MDHTRITRLDYRNTNINSWLVWIISLKCLLGWESLPLFVHSGYVERTRFLMIKIILSCKLSTGARLCSVHGRLYSMWESQPVYGGVYSVGGHDEGYFYPTWMAAQSSDWPSISLGANAVFFEDYLYCASFLFYLFVCFGFQQLCASQLCIGLV